MDIPEDRLRRAVDDVLEPAWPRERRRASQRLLSATLGRVAVFLLALGALAGVMYLLTGMMLPWTFFAVMGGMTALASLHQADDRTHLRRDSTDPPR